MRLLLKNKDGTSKEYHFSKGPIHIGRSPQSTIFLSDRSVSRQHAVIYQTLEGKWMAEDLNSANNTYLNGKVIHKEDIKTGDVLGIAEFAIEITLEAANFKVDSHVHLEDTILGLPHEQAQIVVKTIDSENVPDIKLPAKRIKDFSLATEAICGTHRLEEMLQVLIQLISKQLKTFHIWCALRIEPNGPMTCNSGKSRQGKLIQLTDIMLSDRINEAVEKSHFILIPRSSVKTAGENITSALIVPVTGTSGCFGVIYADSAPDHERFTVAELDYLMLLSIHTASVVKNF